MRPTLRPSSIPSLTPPVESARPHVMLAEDDPDLRALFASGLKRYGYHVTCYANGLEVTSALTQMSRARLPVPNAIVMDIRMPGPSGLEILRALTLAEWKVPVILMTGFGDDVTHARACTLGAMELLNKPLSAARLAAALESALVTRN